MPHVKAKIVKMYEGKIKTPKAVQRTLLDIDNQLTIDEIPTKGQIKNYVYRYKNKKFGNYYLYFFN